MPLIAYGEYGSWKFRKSTLKLISQANTILASMTAQGYSITLRQLYYQFVAQGIIPNTLKSYKTLGVTINRARLAGLIDWDYLEDRTRSLRGIGHHDSPESALREAAEQYAIDKWSDQDTRVEVWIEKDALSGVVQRACNRWDVDYFSCRGYTSQSELWGAAQRHLGYEEGGQGVVVLRLGDHDPSGIDMTRDIEDRLAMFGTATRVCRIALNMNQIQQYNPPPNPAKMTDARFKGYRKLHGNTSWELDALTPSVIDSLIEADIKKVIDEVKFKNKETEEKKQRETMVRAAGNWPNVERFIGKRKDIMLSLDRAIADIGARMGSLDGDYHVDAESRWIDDAHAQRAMLSQMLEPLEKLKGDLTPLAP